MSWLGPVDLHCFGPRDLDCSITEHSDSHKLGNSSSHCEVGFLKISPLSCKLDFDFHLRGACVGDEPEERSPFLDEVSEKFWNEVSERFENAGEGRVEGEIDADLLIEGGR